MNYLPEIPETEHGRISVRLDWYDAAIEAIEELAVDEDPPEAGIPPSVRIPMDSPNWIPTTIEVDLPWADVHIHCRLELVGVKFGDAVYSVSTGDGLRDAMEGQQLIIDRDGDVATYHPEDGS